MYPNKSRNFHRLYQLFLLIFDSVLIFCATFSGDFLIADIMPAFFVFWLLILCRRGFKICKVELCVQIILLVIFFPNFLFFEKYSVIYYIASFFPCLYVNVIFFAIKVFPRFLIPSVPLPFIIVWSPSIVLLLLSLMGLVVNLDATRTSFIFGPNVFYRIIGILFLFQLLMLEERYMQAKISVSKRLLALLFSLISCLSALHLLIGTGSRGATILMVPVILLYLTSVLKTKDTRFKTFLFAFFLPLCLVIISQLFSLLMTSFLSFTSRRSFTFVDVGQESNAISSRYDFLRNFIPFFETDNFLFGEGSSYKYSYPHNLYLDALYNSGIFPFMILVLFTVLFVFMLYRYRLSPGWKAVVILSVPIYIGSLVSGTIYDNYPIISLILVLPINFTFSPTQYCKF